MKESFTIHHLRFTERYPSANYHAQWLMENGGCMVNGAWKMVNAPAWGVL